MTNKKVVCEFYSLIYKGTNLLYVGATKQLYESYIKYSKSTLKLLDDCFNTKYCDIIEFKDSNLDINYDVELFRLIDIYIKITEVLFYRLLK